MIKSPYARVASGLK